MMKDIFRILTLILLVYSFGFASICGIGFGAQEEAKKHALDDLSHNISVVVSSDYAAFVSKNDYNYEKKITKLISTKSELPIIGAKFNYDLVSAQSTVCLDNNSLASYTAKINELELQIQKLLQNETLSKTNSERYAILELSYEKINDLEKHKTVARLLGDKTTHQIFDTAQIQTQMISISQNINSIELASKILASNFQQKEIFVFAPTTNGSKEITPFANALKNSLASLLSQNQEWPKSTYYLSGNYEATNEGVFVTYNLQDKLNNTIKSASIFLNKNAINGLRVQPNELSFDQEIELSSNKLKSDLIVQLGFKDFANRNILLKKGDNVELVAKANKQAYIYIVAHTLKENERFSYLLELQNANGEDKFVYTLGASDANKLVLLPISFEVDKPFGYETLQMFASTTRPRLPVCKYKDGYCVIADEPKEAIQNTRALKPKQKEVQFAEASLSFTTVDAIKY